MVTTVKFLPAPPSLVSLERTLPTLLKRETSQQLYPLIATIFSLEQLAKTQQQVEQCEQFGKRIILP